MELFLEFLNAFGSGMSLGNVAESINDVASIVSSFSSMTNDVVDILDFIKTAFKVFLVIIGALVALMGTVAGVGVVVVIIALIVAICIVCYVIPAVTLSVMGKRAGYHYWWLAIIPFTQIYVMFILPRQNYKLLFFNFKRRYIPAIIYIVLQIIGIPLMFLLLEVPVFGWIVDIILILIFILMTWRLMYDILFMYSKKEISIVLSIASFALPFIFTGVLIVDMFRKPKFGLGNYYDNDWYNAQNRSEE